MNNYSLEINITLQLLLLLLLLFKQFDLSHLSERIIGVLNGLLVVEDFEECNVLKSLS
jgi:hypothetical protein